MKPLSVIRLLEFDAGHRVTNHEAKCATLHGHRYKVEIEATAPGLDAIGRVIDFSVLKDKVGSWLDLHWDHTTLVFKEDQETLACLMAMPRRKDPYVCDWNPTAENMAAHLLNVVCPMVLAGTEVLVTKVVVWETPNCRAEACL